MTEDFTDEKKLTDYGADFIFRSEGISVTSKSCFWEHRRRGLRQQMM